MGDLINDLNSSFLEGKAGGLPGLAALMLRECPGVIFVRGPNEDKVDF